jgi:flavin-dependent dehydrogenase
MRALKIVAVASWAGMVGAIMGGSIAAYSAGREGEGGAAPKNPETPYHRNWRETPFGRELHELNVLYHDEKIDQKEYLRRLKILFDKADQMKPDDKAIKSIPFDLGIPALR